MKAARARNVSAYNDRMTTAYLAALLPYMKNRPPLKDLLRRADSAPRQQQQSWQEIKAALMVALPRR